MDAFLKAVGDIFEAGDVKHLKAYEFLQKEFTSTIQNNISKKATMLAIMGKNFRYHKLQNYVVSQPLFSPQATVPWPMLPKFTGESNH